MYKLRFIYEDYIAARLAGRFPIDKRSSYEVRRPSLLSSLSAGSKPMVPSEIFSVAKRMLLIPCPQWA